MPEELNLLYISAKADQSLVIRGFFESMGAETALVDSGAKALNYLAANQPRFILMDSGLPDISAVSLARVIRQTSQEAILVAVAETDDEGAGYIQSGFDGWVKSPLTLEAVLFAIHLAEQNRLAQIAQPALSPSGVDEWAMQRLLDEFGPDNRGQALELLRIFVSSGMELAAYIRKAILEGEFARLNLPLHSLKSTSRLIGANRLSELCKEWGAREKKQESGPVMENLAHIILGELEIVIRLVERAAPGLG